MTAQHYAASNKPIRAVLAGSRPFLVAQSNLRRALSAFAKVGVNHVDIRISPLGGDDEGPAKVRAVFGALAGVSDIEIGRTLGFQGLLGHAAVALGLVDDYSVGVGYWESFNHAAVISRQRATHNRGKPARAAVPGVYFPSLAATVPRQIGRQLLSNVDVRSRLACRIDSCAADIGLAAADPRPHYLHSRTTEVGELLRFPPAWRPNAEKEKLDKAARFRRLINEQLLPAAATPLGTRTLETLAKELCRHPATGYAAS